MIRSLVAGLALVCACHRAPPAESSGSGSGSGSSSGAAQSFHDGVQALCDLPDHVPDNGEPYEKRLAAVNTWAIANITNPDAKKIGNVGSLSTSRAQLIAAVKEAGVAHCKLVDNGMALQSFGEAMSVVCAARTTHDSEYFKSHLLNPEVITLLEAIGDLPPADRTVRIRDAVTKAGLTTCALVDQMTSLPTAPKVNGAGFIELAPSAPVVSATPTSVVIDGKAIVAIRDGAVDASELEGGAQGLAIPRVREYMKAVVAAKPPSRVQLVVDPSLTYKVLVQLIFTITQAGVSEFSIVVVVGDTTKALPITLPSTKPDTKSGVRPVIAITGPKFLLWSFSGSEGTLKKPKLVAASTTEIGKALAEIVARRWPTAKRSDADRTIVVMADSKTSMQVVADVLAVVRAAPDGKELFPIVNLSTGYE